MKIFNIGADEVPFGAWKKSKVCQEKYGIDFNVNDLYLSNLKRLLTMIKDFVQIAMKFHLRVMFFQK